MNKACLNSPTLFSIVTGASLVYFGLGFWISGFFDVGFRIWGFWIFGFWIMGFWSLGYVGDFGCLIFVILECWILEFEDFVIMLLLDFGILDFGSQQSSGVTWQRSTMVGGQRSTMVLVPFQTLLRQTPGGLPFQTLSTWGYQKTTVVTHQEDGGQSMQQKLQFAVMYSHVG